MIGEKWGYKHDWLKRQRGEDERWKVDSADAIRWAGVLDGNRRLSITFSRGNFSAERIGNEDWRVDRRGDLFGRGPPGRHNFRRGPFYCVPSNRDSRPEILIISTLISSRVEINGTC